MWNPKDQIFWGSLLDDIFVIATICVLSQLSPTPVQTSNEIKGTTTCAEEWSNIETIAA